MADDLCQLSKLVGVMHKLISKFLDKDGDDNGTIPVY